MSGMATKPLDATTKDPDRVCRRCNEPDSGHDSAFDAIRDGWRLLRPGDPATPALHAPLTANGDFAWLCPKCYRSGRPPAKGPPAV